MCRKKKSMPTVLAKEKLQKLNDKQNKDGDYRSDDKDYRYKGDDGSDSGEFEFDKNDKKVMIELN